MKVALRYLRRFGKKLPDRELQCQQLIEGELITTQVGNYKIAEIVHRQSGGITNQIDTLFEPSIVQIRDYGLIFRGIQKVGETSYLQEWSCRIVGSNSR